MSLCFHSRSNHTLSEEIFLSVNTSLESSGYNLSSGRIITGQEEAVAGWIAGNYLSHGLEQSVRRSRVACVLSAPALSVYGCSTVAKLNSYLHVLKEVNIL